MALDVLLAYLHWLTIMTWVVFLTSTAALACFEWLNGAVVARLRLVDRIAAVAAWAVLASGVARILWGPKGAAWLLGQPLLWAKLGLVALMLAAGWRTTRQIARWHADWLANGQLPAADAVAELRRRVMRVAHVMLLLPLAGVLLSRGVGVR